MTAPSTRTSGPTTSTDVPGRSRPGGSSAASPTSATPSSWRRSSQPPREPGFFLGALDALAVDDRGGRASLPARPLAGLDEQGVVQAPERAVPGPQRQVAVDRAPRRQVLGQGAPLAAGGEDVEDAVQHLAHVHRALAAAAPGRRDEGLDQRPFLARRVARAVAPVGPPLLHGPRRASPRARGETLTVHDRSLTSRRAQSPS